ncbi:MAG TPA: hypothetical protein VGN14_14035, partial [Candidatus Elarobacter sp.]
MRLRNVLAGTAVAALVAFIAGCGGSNSLPAPVYPTAPPSVPTSATATVMVNPNGTVDANLGPITGGITSDITFPAGSTTANAVVTMQTALPSGAPTVQNVKRLPSNINGSGTTSVVFFTVTLPVDVTFHLVPDFKITVPFGIGPYAYIAYYAPPTPQSGWTVIAGPASLNGHTYTFSGQPATITLKAGVTYDFVFFTVNSPLPTPSPTPCSGCTPGPTPSPTPTPTPSPTPCSGCTPGPTPSPTPTPTPSPTPCSGCTPSPTPSPTPTPTPSPTPCSGCTPGPTPSPTPTASPTPSATATATATASPTPVPSITFTGTTIDSASTGGSSTDPNWNQPTLFFTRAQQAEQFTAVQTGTSSFTLTLDPTTCGSG